MKLEQAIRLKQLTGDEFLHADPDALDEADRLSIEALKVVLAKRKGPYVVKKYLLPGETQA